MNTTYETSHFVSRGAAIAYYRKQGDDVEAVNRKIAEGLISISRPEVKPGEKCFIGDDGRYFIEEK